MLLPEFLSRKKLSRKYRSIFASKISPVTGVILLFILFCFVFFPFRPPLFWCDDVIFLSASFVFPVFLP